MSLDQIRYFVAVAEAGSITGAARRLHISQPPLTRQIRALEDELGRPLFARHPKGVALLPRGEVFLDHATRILSAVEAAEAAVRDLGPGREGQPAEGARKPEASRRAPRGPRRGSSARGPRAD